MAARKNQGGSDPAALTPEPAVVAPEILAPVQPPEPRVYSDLFKVEFGGRFRFELGGNCTEVRVVGFFPDIGCQKTWTFAFGPAWAEEAMTTIRAWKASRLG